MSFHLVTVSLVALRIVFNVLNKLEVAQVINGRRAKISEFNFPVPFLSFPFLIHPQWGDFIFFLKIIYLFIHRDTEREREAETQAEGEAGTMQRAGCGTRSRVPRIMP